MTYHLTIEEKPSHLHAKVTGTHNEQNIRRFLVEIHEACLRRKCTTVLFEMNLSGPSLNTGSIFDVISERSADGLMFKRMAYVDASPERDPRNMEFAETVAINRGVRIRFFRNVEDAERWILGAASDDLETGGAQEGYWYERSRT
jgi:hypothetical protein